MAGWFGSWLIYGRFWRQYLFCNAHSQGLRHFGPVRILQVGSVVFSVSQVFYFFQEMSIVIWETTTANNNNQTNGISALELRNRQSGRE
jgi:hypothetical protein